MQSHREDIRLSDVHSAIADLQNCKWGLLSQPFRNKQPPSLENPSWFGLEPPSSQDEMIKR